MSCIDKKIGWFSLRILRVNEHVQQKVSSCKFDRGGVAAPFCEVYTCGRPSDININVSHERLEESNPI